MTTQASIWLDAWERATTQPPLERALTLLTAADPGVPEEDVAAWPIGDRDAALMRLRTRLFGTDATAVVDCPRCRTRLETTFRTEDLIESPPDDDLLTFAVGDRRVTLRRVTTTDLRAVAAVKTPLALLERVIVAPPSTDLPPTEDWIDEAARRLELADPQARVELAMRCPECALEWTSPYDVVSFLWDEIDTWADRTLREVHLLASAYGWSEEDILALSPVRRRCYLELVGR